MTEQQQTIREFEEMGFQITSIVDAYQKYKGDKTQMSDFLIQQRYTYKLQIILKINPYNKVRQLVQQHPKTVTI